MRVRWTRTALANLDAEALYISIDDHSAARWIVLRIFKKVAMLSGHPSIGRPGRVPGTRELVVDGTPYIIPYRVKDNHVEILRVFHHSRKWPEKM